MEKSEAETVMARKRIAKYAVYVQELTKVLADRVERKREKGGWWSGSRSDAEDRRRPSRSRDVDRRRENYEYFGASRFGVSSGGRRGDRDSSEGARREGRDRGEREEPPPRPEPTAREKELGASFALGVERAPGEAPRGRWANSVQGVHEAVHGRDDQEMLGDGGPGQGQR